MVEGSTALFLEEKSVKDTDEKPEIELTGHALIFFEVVQKVLENSKKEFLKKLLPNFLNSCKRILKYCPGMSAFNGSWQREPSTFLTIEEAERFVGNDFFNDATLLFNQKLEDENLTVEQTEQVLGAFFISSLMKLYEEVMLHSLFHAKLRELAEQLSQHPLILDPTGMEQGISYIAQLFTADIIVNPQEQFESIFQNLASKNNQTFLDLITLFFLKPFPFEIIKNADFILNNPALIVEGADALMERLVPLNLMRKSSNASLQSEDEASDVFLDIPENNPKRPEEDRILASKQADHVKTAFETMTAALLVVRDNRKLTIVGEDKIFAEFQSIIKVSARVEEAHQNSVIEQLNPIFYQYCLAVFTRKFQQKIFRDFFETSSLPEAVQQVIENTRQMLQSESIQTALQTAHSLQAVVLAPLDSHLYTLEVADQKKRYKVQRLKFFKNHETSSALLNANPLVKALLVSQVPLAVILQILRVDNNFKDVSTVMWLEPGLALIGFGCGLYALRNPKTLVNAPIRILVEAPSASLVVLSKSLEIAISVHTGLFPKEGESGGIGIERFLKAVASGPITVASLFWIYNTFSPHFKEKHFPKRIRLILDFINHFAIYFGLNQIISIDIIKIINRFEKINFTTNSSKILFELLPAFPAFFFAYARVAPIRACKKNNVYVISERVNTAALYGFTITLLINLLIDLYGTRNLPIEQTIFRGVFFPGLVVASIAVMRHFAGSFHRKYAGNPEIIIQEVIKERGLQAMSDGTFGFVNTAQPLLTATSPFDTESMDSDEETDADLLNHAQVMALQEKQGQSAGKEMLLMLYRTFQQKSRDRQHARQQSVINEGGNRTRCCSCAIL